MGNIMNCYPAIIPANVRYDKDLPANAKLLYGELSVLCQQKGFCWATNSYFAKLYDVDTRTVRRWLSALKSKGYIFFEGEDRNDLTEDNFVPQVRQICLTPQDNNVLQNKKNKNKKKKCKGAHKSSGADKEDFGAFDLDLYEEMLRSQDFD